MRPDEAACEGALQLLGEDRVGEGERDGLGQTLWDREADDASVRERGKSEKGKRERKGRRGDDGRWRMPSMSRASHRSGSVYVWFCRVLR